MPVAQYSSLSCVLFLLHLSQPRALLLPPGNPDAYETDYYAFAAALAANSSAWAKPHRGSSLDVHWSAPFLSGGGYCSEATAFALGLADLAAVGGPRVTIEQHGDSLNDVYVEGLSKADKGQLAQLLRAGSTRSGGSQRSAVQPFMHVCHS